jgi:hypothetical protein
VTQAKLQVGGTLANGKVVGTDGTNLLWLNASGLNLPYRGAADTSGWVLELYNTAAATQKGAIMGQAESFKGFGVWGENTSPTTEGSGLFGQVRSVSGFGVWGTNLATTGTATGVKGTTASPDGIGVLGLGLATGSGIGVLGQVSSSSAVGVKGLNLSTAGNAFGVFGQTPSSAGTAVKGVATSTSGSVNGVFGEVSSPAGVGVRGHSNALTGSSYGVYGESRSAGGAGVRGVYEGQGNGVGVSGRSNAPLGIGGHFSATGHGVVAVSNGAGFEKATLDVENTNNAGIAIYAIQDSTEATIRGINTGTGDLLQLYSNPPDGTELRFRVRNSGNVFADGSYNCGLASGCFNSGAGADLAERIDVAGTLEPGDVVEIDTTREGHFRLSCTPLSTLVAGVVSTSPAMTMNNNDLAGDPNERTETRPLLALVGQVPVKVTDEGGSIAVGDLLVTSSSPGHAMRCSDRHLCAGAVVGKALQALASGRGVILMLATLQ